MPELELVFQDVQEMVVPLVVPDPAHPVIKEAQNYLRERKIRKHPFF